MGVIPLENAIGVLIFGLIIVMVLALFLTAQVSLFSTSSVVDKRIEFERARSKENVRISWLSDKEILITNNGPRDTVIRYLYLYYEGSNAPSLYIPLNVRLKVGESKRVDLEALVLSSSNDPYSGLPHSSNGKKYYLCYDGFTPSNHGDYETECFVEHSSEFPSKDKLDSGVKGYSLFRNSSSHGTLQAILHELNNVGSHWTVCAWLKVNLSSSKGDFSLIKFHNDVYFNYDKDLNIIYAEIIKSHCCHGHPLELGRFEENPSNPSEWGLYCVTINKTSGPCGCKTTINFYVNGLLVDSATFSYHPEYKPFKVEIPSNNPSDYWIDSIYLTNRTLSDGEIKMLLNLNKPQGWNIDFSFDYGLKEVARVDVVTDLGNMFSSARPSEPLLGIPSGG